MYQITSATKGLIALLLFLFGAKAFLNLHLNSKLGAVWRPRNKKHCCFSKEPPAETMTIIVARVANGFRMMSSLITCISRKKCKCYFIGNLTRHVQYILDFRCIAYACSCCKRLITTYIVNAIIQ